MDHIKVSFESVSVLLLIDKNCKLLIYSRFIHYIGLVSILSSLKDLDEKLTICVTIFFKLTYDVAWSSNLKAELLVVELHVPDFKAVKEAGINVSNVIVTINSHELI